MKILITSGAGFIGSHLTRNLVEIGHNVVVLDNLSRANKLDKDVLSSIEFHRGDILNEIDVKNAIKGCEIVYHFAAI